MNQIAIALRMFCPHIIACEIPIQSEHAANATASIMQSESQGWVARFAYWSVGARTPSAPRSVVGAGRYGVPFCVGTDTVGSRWGIPTSHDDGDVPLAGAHAAGPRC